MSWPDTYLDARFRGVVFDCLSMDEEVARATVAHSYPFRDGADIEDLGLQATRHHVRATLFGVDADHQLQLLKDALDLPGMGELVHPIYGLLQVVVEGYKPAFDADNTDSVALDITFIESAPRAAFFDLAIPEAQIAAMTLPMDSALATTASGFAQTLRGLLAKANNNRLTQFLAVISQTLTQAAQLGAAVQNTAQSYLDMPASLISELHGALSTLMPNRGAISMTANAPTATGTASAGQVSVFDFYAAQQRILLATPISPTAAASNTPEAVLLAVNVQTVRALVLAQSAQTVLVAELAAPVATAPQLEAMVNVVRHALQGQIDAVQAVYPLELARPIIESLKDTALAVQQAARRVIETRPPLLVRPSPVAGNLRLVAHALYHDHRRAPELLRLNPALRQPNFIQPGDAINAFSK